MSTLGAGSDLNEVLDAYAANASYDEDASVTKARAFATACRILLVRLPTASQIGGASVSMDVSLIRQELNRAQQWLSTRSDNTGGVRVASFENFRD